MNIAALLLAAFAIGCAFLGEHVLGTAAAIAAVILFAWSL